MAIGQEFRLGLILLDGDALGHPGRIRAGFSDQSDKTLDIGLVGHLAHHLFVTVQASRVMTSPIGSAQGEGPDPPGSVAGVSEAGAVGVVGHGAVFAG